MQEQQQNKRQRIYFKPASIDNWEQFKSTWKSVWFSDELNDADESALESFWKEQLSKLEKENDKYCVLVPNMVNKQEKKKQQEEKKEDGKKDTEKLEKSEADKQKERPKQEKVNGKNMKKGFQKKPNNQVKLSPKVIETAIGLIEKDFKEIQYVYESLFMGNQKQLLIYRSCHSMNRYLQRYRLPNDFKPKLQTLNKIMDQIYQKKVKSNIAISTFTVKIRDQLQHQLSLLNKEYKKMLAEFFVYFEPIIQDFNKNSKTISMIVQGIRSEMLEQIDEITKKYNLKMSNKYYQTDLDEARDILIQKKNRFEQQQIEEIPEAKEEIIPKYVYVEAPKLPQAPKDIYTVKLIKKNILKQSWTWRIFLPTCSKYNQFKGLYLRAPEGEGPSQLTVEIEHTAEDIDIELFPYQYGLVTWEIYIWNDVGFTKSIEKIMFFNDFQVKGGPPGKNYKLDIIGLSELGVIIEDPELKKSVEKVKNISIYNSVAICDADGTCGGWGQMYFPENQQKKEKEGCIQIISELFNNQRIENPFLVLKGEFIRKVSCGMGYTLMLSSLGTVWSFGFNGYGQLGQGHLDSDYYCTEPRQLSKFTGDSTNFVIDICATCKGSSFALDNKGTLYRWGYNQVQETVFPIHDRFGTLVNFQTKDIIYQNSTPLVLNKSLISGHVKYVDACNEHYYALTKEGSLYGWGVVKMLGLGVLKNTKQIQIQDIINPIEIISSIESVSTNFHHTIAVTAKGRILGWGKAQHFSKKLTGFYTKPVDITEEYISSSEQKIRMIKAGVSYTVLIREDNSFEIVGSETLLKVKSDSQKNTIVDVTCSKFQECFAILTDE